MTGHMTNQRDLERIFVEKRAYFVRVVARRLGDVGTAEEIVQEAFIQVAESAKNQIIDNLEGYLMRASINLSTDWLRQETSRRRREKNWVETHYDYSDGAETVSNAPSPAETVAARDDLRRLDAALVHLSPQVRTAFTLHKIQGLSHLETAARMGLSRSTVEKHIMNAMRQLLEILTQDGINREGMEEGAPSNRQIYEKSKGR